MYDQVLKFNNNGYKGNFNNLMFKRETKFYRELTNKEKENYEYYIADILYIDPFFSHILEDEDFTKYSYATRRDLIEFINNNTIYWYRAFYYTIFTILIFLGILISIIISFIREYIYENEDNNLENMKYLKCVDFVNYKKKQIHCIFMD